MVSGRLIERDQKYYAVLNLKHPDGSRWQKRVNLELPVKNNRRRAEELLIKLQADYTRKQMIQSNCAEMLFNDYMESWLERKQKSISPTTYRGYYYIFSGAFKPAFQDIRLKGLCSDDLRGYFSQMDARGISPTTQQHHYMLLRQLLAAAVQTGLLENNPIDAIEKPKRKTPLCGHYSVEEAKALWQACKGTNMEILIKLTLFYGLRRSEVLGLKWKDVNFKQNTISICRAVVTAWQDGKIVVCEKEELKNQGSYRTMPLNIELRTLLLKERQKKDGCDHAYICTTEKGAPCHPDNVSHAFAVFLRAHGMRHIRFHGLRHTCASLLLAQRVPLVEVQQWLGHTTILTTANLYGHLDYAAKMRSAETMSNSLF